MDPAVGALLAQAIGILSFVDEVMSEPALTPEQEAERVELQKGSVQASLDATERWKARQAAANETPTPPT